MLKVENLKKDFGTFQAVKGVSFTVGKGEVLGFLGPNGAGKSTTMRMITGFIPPTSGTAVVCGHDILQDPVGAKSCIGYLPENNPLYEEMYVSEYLMFMAQITNDKRQMTNVSTLIDRVGLTPERHKHIRELSKGYRQRVGLAQALLGNPELLILDEPTTGLDPNQLVEIRALIRSLGKDRTVILSTHIMQEVREMCDRVVIIDHGEIKADDPIDQIKDLEKLFRDSTND